MGKEAAKVMGQNLPAEGNESDAPEGDAPPPETPKTFTQDEVNALLAKNKKALQAELAKERQERESLTKKLDDFLNASAPPKDDPKAKTEEGRLEAIEKRYQRQMDELQSKIKEQETRANQEHQRRIEGERDRLLDEALTQAGCIDLKAGRRFFLPDITREDEDGNPADTWLLKTNSGKLIDIATGVMETLPKYLRNPAVNVGGSGTSGGGPKAKDKDALKKLESELEALKAEAMAQGPRGNAALVKYEQKKRELAALRASQKK